MYRPADGRVTRKVVETITAGGLPGPMHCGDAGRRRVRGYPAWSGSGTVVFWPATISHDPWRRRQT